eukprot:TRINITY_DN9188_c0_g1_i2.p1 TRINITY_DN9188_c0_g1~~TRINITY_DN9188_c0_g1_i2.p1  ORF type:complete len:560 (+),score=79.48 TRINITY_DN9188_c0_g1_i2:97-1680(+)
MAATPSTEEVATSESPIQVGVEPAADVPAAAVVVATAACEGALESGGGEAGDGEAGDNGDGAHVSRADVVHDGKPLDDDTRHSVGVTDCGGISDASTADAGFAASAATATAAAPSIAETVSASGGTVDAVVAEGGEGLAPGSGLAMATALAAEDVGRPQATVTIGTSTDATEVGNGGVVGSSDGAQVGGADVVSAASAPCHDSRSGVGVPGRGGASDGSATHASLADSAPTSTATASLVGSTAAPGSMLGEPAGNSDAPIESDVVEDEDDTSWPLGEYVWHSEDGSTDGVIRIKKGGQWWHCVHRRATERCRIVNADTKQRSDDPVNVAKAYKEFGLGLLERSSPEEDIKRLSGDYKDIEVWEIAECVGSWRQDVAEEAKTDPEIARASRAGIVYLTCATCSWKSNCPGAPLALRPNEEFRTEIEDMLADSHIVLRYRQGRCHATLTDFLHYDASPSNVAPNDESPEALSRHAQKRCLQAAFQTLGFSARYWRGHARAAPARTAPTVRSDSVGATLAHIPAGTTADL